MRKIMWKWMVMRGDYCIRVYLSFIHEHAREWYVGCRLCNVDDLAPELVSNVMIWCSEPATLGIN